MSNRLLSAALALGIAGTATAAGAQAVPHGLPCQARDIITERLERKFGEMRTGAGLISDDRVLELWSSVETGSWTLLMTRADGVACILAAGDFWQPVPAELRVPREPA